MNSSALIAAGAVVPGDVEPGDDRDIITARHYAHPALDGRVVVRLVPAVLGVAEDLTCEYLGFAAPTATTEVGTGKRSALGFPAWALVNDPDNGHHALNLVKDVERLARTARSKAGAAKDGFTALGDMLGRSAPHFLPTFYEQAGRIFLEHNNTSYAATMFGKAREAEEVHDLTVDPERLREVFLEFAFAGALTAKALSAHAKGLARRHDPDAAYELFLTLCVERTRGGLPPYTGMPEDLRRLARAAKRNLATEDERLLRAVLDTSAIDGAGATFWKYYRDALVRLAGRDDAVRDQLLRFVPAALEALDTWLDILTASSATRALTEPATGEPDAVSPAAWLSSVCRVRMGSWRATAKRSERLLEIVAAMAGRLAADGVPVHAVRGWRHHELDLVDLLLTHGVPVTADRDQPQFTVGDWLSDDQPGRRDLAALGSTEPYLTALGDSLVEHLRSSANSSTADRDSLVAALAVPGLRAALNRWLAGRAGQTRPARLPGLDARLRELAVVRLGEAFGDVPEAAEAIAATDVADALHATLRTGILDELGWPALDEAVTRLRVGGHKDEPVVVCGEGWPALVLGRGENFVVAGPDGVLAEHVSRIPPDARNTWSFAPQASWFDGVLLVRWDSPDGELAYWSDAPSTMFRPAGDSRSYYRRDTTRSSIALAGGARFGGHRAVRPGDRDIAMDGTAYGDGTTVWTTAYRKDAWRWVEVDPATGEQGRASLPAFVEDFAADGTELALMVCSLRPATESTMDSPLGAAGGLHGWRVRKESDGGWLAEGVDGRRVRWPARTPTPTGLLTLPGGGQLVLSEGHSQVQLLDTDRNSLALLSSSMPHPTYAAGTPFVAPRDWWHLLRPRDEAGSAALRQVSRDAVDKLVAAAAAAPDRDRPSAAERYAALMRGERDALATAVTEAIPGLTHPALIAGVLDLALCAARLLRGYQAFGEVAEAARTVDLAALAPSGPVVTSQELSTALRWFHGSDRYHQGNGSAKATALPELLTALTGAAAQPPTTEHALPAVSVRWFEVVPQLAALAHRAASPLTPDDQREVLVYALRLVADSGLADDDGHWRVITVVIPESAGVRNHHVLPVPDGFVALFHRDWHQGDGNLHTGLQYTATSGTFALPRDWRLSDSTDLAQPFGRDRITRFLDVLAERGPVPWRPEDVPALVELTGLGAAEATVLLAGMPAVDDWSAAYLDAGQRRLLGLSAAEAKAAKQRLRSLSDEYRRSLLAAAVPEDPAGLWTEGPDVPAVAAAWTAAHGVRRAVPDDVLVDAARQLPMATAAAYVTAVVNPDLTSWLTEDSDVRFNGAELTGLNQNAFTGSVLRTLPGVLLWLAQRLSVGSPLRAQLSATLALARQRVAHPGFAVDLGSWNDAKAVRDLLGVDLPATGTVADHRPWLHLVSRHHEVYCGIVVRPGLIGPADRPLLAALAELTGNAWLPVALDTLADDRVAAACAATVPADTDPAAAPQDPTVTVPHLVDEVAAKLGLDADAAVLYLQLLALPDPTDTNTARWTGWKPARLRAARTALAASDLVLTAKRARAGRSQFLPGGWLALSRPHLPLESWKAPMYGITDTVDGVVVPREPIADLFTRAWQRVLDGDTPAYEQLRTRGRR